MRWFDANPFNSLVCCVDFSTTNFRISGSSERLTIAGYPGFGDETLAPFDLWTRKNQNQKIFIAYWLVTCQNQSGDWVFWFWFLLVHKSNAAFDVVVYSISMVAEIKNK